MDARKSRMASESPEGHGGKLHARTMDDAQALVKRLKREWPWKPTETEQAAFKKQALEPYLTGSIDETQCEAWWRARAEAKKNVKRDASLPSEKRRSVSSEYAVTDEDIRTLEDCAAARLPEKAAASKKPGTRKRSVKGQESSTLDQARRGRTSLTGEVSELGEGAATTELDAAGAAQQTPLHENEPGTTASVGRAAGSGTDTDVADQGATASCAQAEVGEATEPPPLEPPLKPEWRVLDPKDQSDPVEHEVCEYQKRNEKWALMAASVRGKLHAHKAMWREDAYAWLVIDDWTVFVVSDGAGSASLSRIGARIACDESAKRLGQLLSGYRLGSGGKRDMPLDADMHRLRTFLADGARQALRGILREVKGRNDQGRKVDDRDCTIKDMHATLLLMFHVPWEGRDLVGAVQVGDGAVGIYTDDDTCTLMGVADHGEFSSETRFLTTPNIEYEFEQRVLFTVRKNVRCLAAMCDGVADDFFPEDKRLVELFNGNPIADLKTQDGQPVKGVLHDVVKNPRNGEALLKWLKYEKRGSSDDRTLLLMHRDTGP